MTVVLFTARQMYWLNEWLLVVHAVVAILVNGFNLARRQQSQVDMWPFGTCNIENKDKVIGQCRFSDLVPCPISATKSPNLPLLLLWRQIPDPWQQVALKETQWDKLPQQTLQTRLSWDKQHAKRGKTPLALIAQNCPRHTSERLPAVRQANAQTMHYTFVLEDMTELMDFLSHSAPKDWTLFTHMRGQRMKSMPKWRILILHRWDWQIWHRPDFFTIFFTPLAPVAAPPRQTSLAPQWRLLGEQLANEKEFGQTWHATDTQTL